MRETPATHHAARCSAKGGHLAPHAKWESGVVHLGVGFGFSCCFPRISAQDGGRNELSERDLHYLGVSASAPKSGKNVGLLHGSGCQILCEIGKDLAAPRFI